MNKKNEKFLAMGVDAAVIVLASVATVAGFAADLALAALDGTSKASNPRRLDATPNPYKSSAEDLSKKINKDESLGMHMAHIVKDRISSLREKLNEPTVENKGMKIK